MTILEKIIATDDGYQLESIGLNFDLYGDDPERFIKEIDIFYSTKLDKIINVDFPKRAVEHMKEMPSNGYGEKIICAGAVYEVLRYIESMKQKHNNALDVLNRIHANFTGIGKDTLEQTEEDFEFMRSIILRS